jgi:hypothetical protein
MIDGHFLVLKFQYSPNNYSGLVFFILYYIKIYIFIDTKTYAIRKPIEILAGQSHQGHMGW